MRTSRSLKIRGDARSSCGTPFVLIWLLGWSAITLTFDGFVVMGITQQIRSANYESTAGSVTKSQVVVHHDSDGDSHSLDIEYVYEVNGVEYKHDRYRYGFGTSGEHEVRRIVKDHPAGSAIDVYYNPADPQDALLAPGISWFDLFIPLFMMPFNLIMIGMFSVTLGASLRRWLGRRPLSVNVKQRNVVWTVKVYEWLPITSAGATALGVSFVSIFVVGFGQIILPGWWLVAPAWFFVLLFSLVAWFLTKPSARAELDEYQQRLTLHLKRFSEPIQIDFADIESIQTDQKGVVIKSASRNVKLPTGGERESEWLAKWLRERLGKE